MPTITRWRGRQAFPGLLLTLTIITGVVDAVSYLAFDHVFVANMTGNVVFIGFGLAGASSISALASLVAIAAFLLGALGGGRLGRHLGGHRGHHLAVAATIGLAGLIVALLVSLTWGYETDGPRYLLTAVLAMLVGALVGALLVLKVSVPAALALACLLQAAVAVAGRILSDGSPAAEWAAPARAA